MQIYKFLVSALQLTLVFSIVASGSNAQSLNNDPQLDGEIEVGEDAISDEQIRQRIRQVLNEIGGYEGVAVTVSSGVVTVEGIVLDGAAEEELIRILGRVTGVVTIDSRVTQSSDLNERLAPAFDRVIDRGERVLVNTPIFLVAVAVFAATAFVGWLLTTRLTLWQRLAPNSFIADIYRAVARIGFILIGLVLALDILNATALLGAVLGAAGVVGLAVGFAVRDTVENFIASILLSLRQPFRPNDFIEIAGDMGNVARLTSRATILISPDGNHVRIPNSTVFKGRIVNYTRDPSRRFVFELGVDADSDLAAALSISVDALESLPFVLSDPPVGAWIKQVGDSNVVLTFAAWVDQRETDFLKSRGEAIRVTKNALEAAGFGLPEPIYRLRVEDQASLSSANETTEQSRQTIERPTELKTELPMASSPDIVEQATEDAVDREQNARDASANLLSESRGSE
ncbi:MAG: mechanosensitive ion channel family protein [Pseudomonadota bacterium]